MCVCVWNVALVMLCRCFFFLFVECGIGVSGLNDLSDFKMLYRFGYLDGLCKSLSSGRELIKVSLKN